MAEITDEAREPGRGERALQSELCAAIGYVPGQVNSARLLARYLSAQAMVNQARFERSVHHDRPDLAACGLLTAQFAAAHALIALAETSPATADQAAAEIQEAWEMGESAEWTSTHLEDRADAVFDIAGKIADVPAAWQVPALGEAGEQPDVRGETTTAPKTEVQWAVAYGGDDPNECAGVLEYDDRADAEEHLQWVPEGFLATRTLTVWPWQRAEVTSDGQ